MRVRQFAAQHVDEKGNRYDGYELIVQDIPISNFSRVCTACGKSSFKVRQVWENTEQCLVRRKPMSLTIDTEGKPVIIDVPWEELRTQVLAL